ncbi:hypothetical protein SAMN04487859_1522 [Roseovarius lutimaris]|uniref:Rcc01698-like C-terminal domain-containing protein n=1 Tax=Roseovarius lutimaris TaxID=1005928 RepID=A0A1I5H3I1_9RHOB|nr:hypothetical protein SAMN04487859_1522 [Roseovarius lutimaris]
MCIFELNVADLIAPGRYRLTRLLRGQRGTEAAMANPVPARARVVVLDASLASLPIAESDLGLPWNWRIGPASQPVSNDIYGRGIAAASMLMLLNPLVQSRKTHAQI